MRRLKKIQQGTIFNKPVSIDLSKDLTEQPWFKGDLFNAEEKKDIEDNFLEEQNEIYFNSVIPKEEINDK
jgi:hypothetical protein